ncbi:MAG TPA: hypothetical protein VFG20_18005, partial [Planctomycetaceae bacterium]|nr:hypothetical protein [Planctomycetaceae bacterium]
MSDVWTIPRIRQELDRLADWRGRLADALTEGASQLEAVGAVPDDALLTELTDYRQRMRTLGFRMTGQTPATGEQLSLTNFESLLKKSQQCEELVYELAAIKDLEHIDDADYTPLVRCRDELERCAERLTGAIDPSDADQTLLFERQHPLQAVLALLDSSSAISDTEWNERQDRVVHAYGRAFAAALIRGKIRRRAGATAVPVDLVSTARVAVADGSVITDSPSVTEEPDDHTVRWFQSGSSILPGVTTTAPSPEVTSTEEASTTSEASPPVPDISISLNLPNPVRHTDAAAQLAREIAGETPPSAARLKALVQQLLRDGRVALAANLADCVGRLPASPHMAPPAGLLRALALGTSLSYSRGELARAVEQELRPFVTTAASAAVKDDARYGIEFQLRAAALLPALLGASPAASAILRSFAIEPGLSQLYNYCHRVALFGERLQSQAVELFQAPAEQAQWLAERQLLQSEVRQWLDHAVARGVQYQRSSPLFLHAHWTVMASP